MIQTGYQSAMRPTHFKARISANRNCRTFGSLAALALALASCGTASIRPDAEKQGMKSSALYEGKHAIAPFAHVVFCHRYPRECTTTGNAAVVQLTPAKNAELHAVNDEINASIRPQADSPDVLGGDIWTLSPAAGDCDDYAVTKRHELLKRGWPSGALRLTEGVTRQGEGHLVLIAVTDQGAEVLDNESSWITSPASAGLKWRSIQSASNPHVWLPFDGTVSAINPDT